MKKIIIALLCIIMSAAVHAQTADTALLTKNAAYTGADATKKHYKAIYQLDTNDPKLIEMAFHFMNNALDDPRLQGKLEIELITFAAGTDIVLKGSKYEEELKSLIQKGVIVAQCHNSMVQRKITRDKVYDFVAVVPSANGELIIRGSEGWVIVKP
ncbi:MAG TPA: DsrE family protein [Chitinophagaceae bacterium]|nr:DsrE family protein [Chitinophagaceae bacterium]